MEKKIFFHISRLFSFSAGEQIPITLFGIYQNVLNILKQQSTDRKSLDIST